MNTFSFKILKLSKFQDKIKFIDDGENVWAVLQKSKIKYQNEFTRCVGLGLDCNPATIVRINTIFVFFLTVKPKLICFKQESNTMHTN